MWIAGAYGNSDVYLTDLSNITAGGLDTLTFKKVIILRETTKNNSKKPWHKVIQGTYNSISIYIYICPVHNLSQNQKYYAERDINHKHMFLVFTKSEDGNFYTF